ncbi:hypothetical protein GCK72_023441 [Caenorhabditis remanei]|uniref:Uncharacterized protein n=1 Tax=Caenorhabditis remanei TaxID=31234 RepID=A0A6A5FWP6_CAERE|nr:hypothetical protein GCK72_023441 [Caenorhabditis remanei]KAF1746983.1 hypothetical protein GCK72_023441 [Caenorhabditis remanei]
MTSTRPKRSVRNLTPAPPVEDDATIVRSTLDRLIYTVDVIARFDQTRRDVAAVQRGESNKTMAQVMTEARWHEHATKAKKDCPLGSTKKKKYYTEEEVTDDDEEDDPNVPSTSTKHARTPKPTPEKKVPTPSKAKLAAMKKKADAEKRKAMREAKKLEALNEKAAEEEEADESYLGMPVLENAEDQPTTSTNHESMNPVLEDFNDVVPEVLEEQRILEEPENPAILKEPINNTEDSTILKEKPIIEGEGLAMKEEKPTIEEEGPVIEEVSAEEPSHQPDELITPATNIEQMDTDEPMEQEPEIQQPVAETPIPLEQKIEEMEVDDPNVPGRTQLDIPQNKTKCDEPVVSNKEEEKQNTSETTENEVIPPIDVPETEKAPDTSPLEKIAQPTPEPLPVVSEKSIVKETEATSSVVDPQVLEKPAGQDAVTQKPVQKEHELVQPEPPKEISPIVSSQKIPETERPQVQHTQPQEQQQQSTFYKPVPYYSEAEEQLFKAPEVSKQNPESTVPLHKTFKVDYSYIPITYQSTEEIPNYYSRRMIKPWIGNDVQLYPLDCVPLSDDTPGRVWYPPRRACTEEWEPMVEIGPLTEMQTLELTLCPEFLLHCYQEKCDLIVERLIELQTPFVRMKHFEPRQTQEIWHQTGLQLEKFEETLDEINTRDIRRRMRVACLPKPQLKCGPRHPQCIRYAKFDNTWYTSSRKWRDRSCMAPGYYARLDTEYRFTNSKDPTTLNFRMHMSEISQRVHNGDLGRKIRTFYLPLIYDISKKSPLVQQRMMLFRERLARYFQYEDFERSYMDDPACREIYKKLRPLPFENGVVIDEAEEELDVLIAYYKSRHAVENPPIQLPKAGNEKLPNRKDIARITERLVADIVDCVVFREHTGLHYFPYRAPIHNNAIPP